MEINYIGLGIGIIIGHVGMFLINKFTKPSCKHTWEKIDEGVIRYGSSPIVKALYKVYECKHCKEMKTIRSDKP